MTRFQKRKNERIGGTLIPVKAQEGGGTGAGGGMPDFGPERQSNLIIKSPFLLLALGFLLFASSSSFAEDEDLGSLNQRIYQLYAEGKYPEAIPLAEKAVEIATRVHGPEDPETATSLNNLGELYFDTYQYTKALALLQEALRIRQKILGPEHPYTATSLNNLALLEFDLGRIEEATAFARYASAAQLVILSKIFSFTSEQQRLAYLDIFHPYSLFPFLKGTETDLAEVVLRYKGVVLDSIVEDRLDAADLSSVPGSLSNVSRAVAVLIRTEYGAHQNPGLILRLENTHMSEIMSQDAVSRKVIVRYDDDYTITAVDGTVIGLPWKNHMHVKFPAAVSVTIPTDNTSYYMVTIVPKDYTGFLDKWTDKIFNSPALLKLASTSLPRGAGYAMFGFSGALVGAVLATLFTPSDISSDTKLEKDLPEGVHVVYWVTTDWNNL